jgi:catechol 2,3-dioxygenase-like lactoylglutathione lyase family enzyme
MTQTDGSGRLSAPPTALDHVALWVEDRDPLADFACEHLGMHVIDRTERFTLVGADARRGKLTLFAAEGPREPGALKHVALRVSSLDRALGELDGVDLERSDGAAYFDVHEGLRLGLVEAPTEVEYDLDHVALWSASPKETAQAYEQLGFAGAGTGSSGAPRVEAGGAFVEFHDGQPGDPERPLLNHLAVKVDSADEHIAEARELGIEIADIVDAANTYAVFVWGPERVKIEYVEHKPSFSLT